MIWQWEHTAALFWLLLLPATVLLVWHAYRQTHAMWNKTAASDLIQTWRPYQQRPISNLFILLLFAMAFLVLSYANPQGGSREAKGYSRNQNVVIAMDLSQSMRAADVKPDRLERAKLYAYDLLENLQGQRVGLVVFAGNAYLHLPLTTDYAACALFISNITPEMIPTQGTDIASALERSLVAIQSGGHVGASSAVVLISDGEDHDKGALAMTKKLKKQNITIYTVGAGTAKGAPVPEQNSSMMKKDDQGKIVISKLNEKFMEELAEKGGGSYFRTSAGKRSAIALAKDINKVASGKEEKATFNVQQEWYSYLLVTALLLMIATFFVQEKLISSGENG